MDIIVVGAGVYGVTAALELAKRGHDVSLFDPGPLPHPDASSTDISKAIRMDYGADEFYMALMEVCFERWDAWNAAWDEKLYHPAGFLFMASGEMKPGGYEHDSYQLLLKRGHEVERMTPETLRQRHPAWNADRYPDGYYNPRAGWAESGRVVAKLIELARGAGVQLREGMRFERLLEDGSRVGGIVTADGEAHRADVVVVATGAWTPILLPHLQDVMWVVGQPVYHFKVDNPTDWQPPKFHPWAADIAHSGWYGFPAKDDGTLKVANHGPGVRVHPDDPRTVPAHYLDMFREFFKETFPALVDAPKIGERLCLYCDTWDGDFWIDRDPKREGLVVSTGGSGHGFKFAPVLGEIAADAVEGRPNEWARRFAWRERGERTTEDARFIE